MTDLSAAFGVRLDGWQELILEAAMGERSDRTWAAKRVGISIPRQNGKSQLLVARALAGALLFGEKKIVVSAHQQDTARESFTKLMEIVEDDRNESLRKRIKPNGIMTALNREAVKFSNGATIQFKARSGAAGKGFSSDCLLLDEAQILGSRAWTSINSTMSAMQNPQVWLLGTPPQDEDDCYAFDMVRRAALGGKSMAGAWCEWASDPGAEDYDPASEYTRWSANPAWNTRINHEVVQGEFETYTPERFAQDRLGIWSTDAAAAVFGEGKWGNCRGIVPDQRRAGAVGIAVGVDLAHAAVVLAGRTDDRVLPLPVAHGAGTDWVIDRAVSTANEHRVPIVLDGGGPAAFLVEQLRKQARAKGVRIVEASLPQMKDACAAIYLQVQSGELLHGGWPELDAAVAGAVQRTVGDRWLWGRRGDKKSAQLPDISLLEAATVALWGQDNVRTRSAADQRLAEGGPAVLSI